MISPRCFKEAWIREQAAALRARDLRTLEKNIVALELVSRLRREGLEFIFKGGTSLALFFDPVRRLSIDVDILSLEPIERLKAVLDQATTDRPPFAGYEHQEHRDREAPPTVHFRIPYSSALDPGGVHTIQLDVITAESPYAGAAEAPTAAGSYAVVATVTNPNYQGSASGTLVIEKAAATVTLDNLTQTYDGTPKPATVTPSDLAVNVTYAGAAEPPTAAGSYAVVATVTNPNYQGSAAGTLVIDKATATVALANLNQTYDGTPKPVAVTLTPTYLAASVTYAGSAVVPSAVGNYAVVATVTDPNYQGSNTGELVIAPTNDWASRCAGHFSEAEIVAGLAGDQADPDADGLPNLAEYALGADPRHFTPPLVAVLDSNGLSLTFIRPANLPGLTYYAESSVDFGAWTTVPLEVLEQGSIETVRARDALTTGDPTRRFLRLRFQRQ